MNDCFTMQLVVKYNLGHNKHTYFNCMKTKLELSGYDSKYFSKIFVAKSDHNLPGQFV